MKESARVSTFILDRYFSTISLYSGIIGFSAAAVAAKGIPDPWISVVSFLAPALGGTATVVLNDYFDREVDRYRRPWSPLVSGKMKAQSALILASVSIATGFVLTIALYNLVCFLIALLALVLALTYNVSRGRRYMTHGFLALNPALCVIYGYAAAAGGLSLELTPLVLMMALILFMDAFSAAMVTSVRDVAEDRTGGAITASVKFGVSKTVKFSLLLLISSMALGFLPFMLGYLNVGYLMCFITTRVILFAVHAFSAKNPNRRLSSFITSTEVVFGMCIPLSFLVGVLPINIGIMLAIVFCILMIEIPITYYKHASRPEKT